MVTNFRNLVFGSYVCFPVLEIEQENNQKLGVKILIAQKLYEHCYPVLLPEEFLIANSKHTISIKLALLNDLTQTGIEKVFHCEAFLSEYKISNRKKYNIKNLIIDDFLVLVEAKKIKRKLKIITKTDSRIEAENLTIELLNKSRLIYFYEKVGN